MEMFYIFLVLIVIVLIFIIITYNSLIAKRNDVKNIYASVDVQLKQRYDLIPNLVASVKAYLSHEKEVLENVTRLRQNAMSSTSDKEKFDFNNQLSSALGGLNVTIENYPTLKANENILNLQKALKDCEEQISAARRAYNSAVTIYNNACEMFPSNLIANWFKFEKAEVFEAKEQERATPNVKDLFNS